MRTVQTLQEQCGDDAKAVEEYLPLARLLSSTYVAMIKERDFLQSVLNHTFLYTEDMAIADLTHISTRYSSDTRVQNSYIPNQPESITLKLEDGYVEKMNQRLQTEAKQDAGRLDYLNWKIDVVDTAIRCRCNRFSQTVFKNFCLQGKSYKTIRGESSKAVYLLYRNWCQENNYNAENIKNFKDAMGKRFTIARKHPKDGGEKTTMIVGVRIREEEKGNEDPDLAPLEPYPGENAVRRPVGAGQGS